MLRRALNVSIDRAYRHLARPLLFRTSAQETHERLIALLHRTDAITPLAWAGNAAHAILQRKRPVTVGGVRLPQRIMLAAGFVKGMGFASEAEAVAAAESGQNIIPGWRTMPHLVGPVEFGSYTRYPRLGNPGVVMWRHDASHSTQNRVGLKNPGAVAAATFLARNRRFLPSVYGINIAVSPGVDDVAQQATEIGEAMDAFIKRCLRPDWFTLNVSCPNTEDDPGGHQTENSTRRLCQAAMDALDDYDIPLWVKISPDLSPEQYAILIRVFIETGVQAVIATNTLPQPSPTDPALMAGVGGQRLTPFALEAVRCLQMENLRQGGKIDIIACGGLMDGHTMIQYEALGVRAMQVYSALVFRGPFAAAIIESERS